MRRNRVPFCFAAIGTIFVIVAVLVAGCSKPETNELKIGVIFPLTGSGAAWGEHAKNGVLLAEEEINSSGGIGGRPLKLLIQDSGSVPKGAISAFSQLTTTPDIQACVVDMISGNVLAIAPLAEQKKIVIISPGASSPKITDAGDYIFRNWPSDAMQGRMDAEYAYKILGWKSAAILSINNEYGSQLRDIFSKTFKELGGRISGDEQYEQGGADFRDPLSKLKQASFDGIFVACYPAEAPILIKQARELGILVPLLGTETFADPAVLNGAGSAMEGAVYSIAQSPDATAPKVAAFRSAYKKRFGKEYGAPGDVAYDAVYILKWAIDQVGYKATAVKDKLYELRDYDGVSGLTTFDKNGDAIKPFELRTVHSGKTEKCSKQL